MSRCISGIIIFLLTLTGGAAANDQKFSFYSYYQDPGDGTQAEARAIVREILDAIDVEADFEVRAAKIPNAAAATSKGQKFILYNPAFIGALFRATGSNRWVPVSILAHEIGHHLRGHTIVRTNSSPSIELEADVFAGFVLRRMGAGLEDAQMAIRLGSSRRATATHPGREDRLIAIASGWEQAGDLMASHENLISSPISAPGDGSNFGFPERYIAYDVHFEADPSNKYHVTTRNNLVKLAGDTLTVFGQLVSVDNDNFPFALKTAKHMMFVSRRGSIVSEDGRTLGYVKAHNSN